MKERMKEICQIYQGKDLIEEVEKLWKKSLESDKSNREHLAESYLWSKLEVRYFWVFHSSFQSLQSSDDTTSIS